MEYEERIGELIAQGFDVFIGRSIETRNLREYERYAHVELRGLGRHLLEISPISLRYLLWKLCYEVKNGRKVLIAKSPGYIPPREHQVSDFVDVVRKSVAGDDSRPVKKSWEIADPVTFLVFHPEELSWLERGYNKKRNLKDYPNPFLYQPK